MKHCFVSLYQSLSTSFAVITKKLTSRFTIQINWIVSTQLTITYSKSTIETLEKGASPMTSFWFFYC